MVDYKFGAKRSGFWAKRGVISAGGIRRRHVTKNARFFSLISHDRRVTFIIINSAPPIPRFAGHRLLHQLAGIHNVLERTRQH
jgi:hypothetical protein